MSQLKRTRNYVAIGYPESLDPNWLNILESTHISILVSPLHDRDVNPDGTIKKAHYHIMLLFEAPKTREQAQEIFDSIKATKCEIVNSTRGQARYLCHLDNQEKEQYSTSDVIALNGIDYYSLIELPSDNWQAVREMLNFIEENDIEYFSDLMYYASIHNENWYKCLLQHNTIAITEYIKSRSYKKSREAGK